MSKKTWTITAVTKDFHGSIELDIKTIVDALHYTGLKSISIIEDE